MSVYPRLGLAVDGDGPGPSPAGLALLAALATRRGRVQHFRSEACPTGTGIIRQVTGSPGRHLDAWLMPEEVCRRVFARGAALASVALVEGTLDGPAWGRPAGQCPHDRPGLLAPIARALDLPTIAVVACPGPGEFHLPNLPDGVDAILLDDLADPADFPRLRHLVSLLTRRPVVGAVESLPEVRRALAAVPPGGAIPDADAASLVAALLGSFLRFADLAAIDDLARSRPFGVPCGSSCPGDRRRIKVAYALDGAFGGYYPDTLETLEDLGADLVDFSPLRDETLPPDVDLVLIGCGVPDEFADVLAANQCMMSALRAHVCGGRRIYSEGGGTAYLGRSMHLRGRSVPGVGIFPIDATLRANPTPPAPVERTLTRDGWLGLRGQVVCGYRSGRWDVVPAEIEYAPCRDCSGPLSTEGDLLYHHHAVGSLIHLHLGALPEVVSAFLGVHRPSLTLPTVRRDR